MIPGSGPDASPSEHGSTRRDPADPGGAGPLGPPSSPHERLVFRLITFLTLAALVAITVVFPAATRMYATPWNLLAALACLGPAFLLTLRGFDRTCPLALPATRWCIAAFATAGVVLVSAIASPYRASAVLWSAPLLSSVAVFFVAFDWLHAGGDAADDHRARAWRLFSVLLGVVALASIAEWLAALRTVPLSNVLQIRNPYPLGHSNYTAGLALLAAPCFAVALRRGTRTARMAAGAGLLLALAMLFTSGSRGGVIAAAVPVVIALWNLPARKATKLRIAVIALVAASAFVAANPRTRALFLPAAVDAPPNISNVQRSAMAVAGIRMGSDRPLLGWGPGTTPLAFPRYRAGLDGGAENVLQLHSLPVQLWAELGAGGVALALLGLILLMRDGPRDKLAAATLAGYAVFSLFDAQLDVPIFGFSVAFLAALIAAPSAALPACRPREPAESDASVVAPPSRPCGLVGLASVLSVLAVLLLGSQDPTPRLNAEALRIGRNDAARAITLLRESLRLNPDQELAHFNLGWLLVVADPAQAASHFTAAARLAPDKGGVYLGLGLARLNAGDRVGAARALALEALNDPVFLLSPWWKEPSFVELRADTLGALAAYQEAVLRALPEHAWAARETRYLQALNRWIEGVAGAGDVAEFADTPERRAYFAANPSRAELQTLETRMVTYERVGYPVLVRNLDIAPPVDVWTSRETTARESPVAFLWPGKGWVPSPLLIALLDGRDLRHN